MGHAMTDEEERSWAISLDGARVTFSAFYFEKFPKSKIAKDRQGTVLAISRELPWCVVVAWDGLGHDVLSAQFVTPVSGGQP